MAPTPTISSLELDLIPAWLYASTYCIILISVHSFLLLLFLFLSRFSQNSPSLLSLSLSHFLCLYLIVLHPRYGSIVMEVFGRYRSFDPLSR